jgi:hypothetical protein
MQTLCSVLDSGFACFRTRPGMTGEIQLHHVEVANGRITKWFRAVPIFLHGAL